MEDQEEGWSEHREDTGEGWRLCEDTGRIKMKDGGNERTQGGSGKGLLQHLHVILSEPNGPCRSTV